MKSFAYPLFVLVGAGCGGSGVAPAKPVELAVTCAASASADFYTLPSDLPAWDASHRGDVFKCDRLDDFSPADVNALLKQYDYTAAPTTTEFIIFRIAYRTERAAPTGATAPEGDSAALVLVPRVPNNLPLVVFAHGSVGIAEPCAPSRRDLRATPPPLAEQSDWQVNLLALAGHGYTVIAPDYSGFAFGQPPGYFSAADEGKALLDATRAAAQVLPAERRPSQVALVGHSQGGHAVLAAQSLHQSYGMTGSLTTVVAYAPAWFSMASYAAITSAIGTLQFNTTDSGYAILFSSEYLYSAGELLDGPGHGADVFAADKRAAAEAVLRDGPCFDFAGLKALAPTAYDFYDSVFTSEVANDCAISGSCTTPLSMKWLARWQADRPPIDPSGPPILIWNGGADTLVPPGLAQCGRDNLGAGGALATNQITNCFDPDLGHTDMVRRAPSDQVNQWIDHLTVGGPAPAACTPFPTGVTCTMPPKNL